MTDITTRLQELQETIRRAQAEIEALQKSPMQKAVEAFDAELPGYVGIINPDYIEAGLRAAWPHLKEAMGDGWIPWAGGPVAPALTGVPIEIRFANGKTERTHSPPVWSWTWDGCTEPHGYHIVAYRVVP